MFSNHAGFLRLQRAYQQAAPDSFGLYLGAGVNLPAGENTPRYGTYSWPGLLEELYNRNRERSTVTFDDLRAQYGDDLPGLAGAIAGSMELDEQIQAVDEIIQSDMPRGDRYGRLSITLLRQAPTLHAAICFSARIRSRTKTSWTFERNPRIDTIITTNYDFFFAAGWTRYQAFKTHWKVQTMFSTKQPTPAQRTINYIHGYISYRPHRQHRPIALTQQDYELFYPPGRFAHRTLWNAVLNYHLLFLGTSFSDAPLCEMLLETKTGDTPSHFAIVTPDLTDLAQELGVCPVEVNDCADIGKVLEAVYCSALDEETCRRAGVENPAGYWDRLKRGPVK